MGLASALSTALTGLTASETTIDTVGNNLANANTMGFKASTASFATQFLQTQSLGSAPTDSNGGTDPRQVGLGTMVADVTPNFNQGTIAVSSNPTDLAIQGDGFFIVQGGSGGELYTRNGMFKMNAKNEMVTNTGNRVLGFGVDSQYKISTTTLQPIVIPLGSAAVAQATQNAYLQGTLTPTGDLATQGTILNTAVLGDAYWTQPATGASAMQVPQPAAATAAGGTSATGQMSVGDTYSYKLVYVDSAAAGGNEGTVSNPTASVTLTAGQNAVTLTNLPTPPAGTQLEIYRTDHTGGAATYKLRATLANPGASWTDGADDSVLTKPLAVTPQITGNYNYYVTYATAAGGPGNGLESRATAAGQVTVNNGQILFNGPPADTSSQWSYMRIYRNAPSSGDPSKYYMVDEINTTTTPNMAFIDHVSDATLVAAGQKLDFTGPKANANTLAVNLLREDGATYTKIFSGPGTLQFTGNKGDRTLTPKTYALTAGTTAQALASFMSDTLGIQADPTDPLQSGVGGSVSNGQITIKGNTGADNALTIDLSAMQFTTAAGTTTVNMPFNASQSAVGESAMTDFIAYDSLGIPLNVHLTAVLESRDSTSTTYRWFADCPQNVTSTSSYASGSGSGLIKFDGSGNFITASNSKVQIFRADVSARSPLTFNLDFTQLSGLAASTSSMAVSRQDGSPPGVLNSFQVGEDGLLRGVFSNGITQDLGQIRLARFANVAGLQQQGENLFSSGVNSGLPVEGNPGEQGIGKIVAGATELSNTDIGSNLIDLILASTMYRGNSRVITTIQQMFDELMNLKTA